MKPPNVKSLKKYGPPSLPHHWQIISTNQASSISRTNQAARRTIHKSKPGQPPNPNQGAIFSGRFSTATDKPASAKFARNNGPNIIHNWTPRWVFKVGQNAAGLGESHVKRHVQQDRQQPQRHAQGEHVLETFPRPSRVSRARTSAYEPTSRAKPLRMSHVFRKARPPRTERTKKQADQGEPKAG